MSNDHASTGDGSPESASGAPHPAANQPDQADVTPMPGHSGGVTVPSAESSLGTSQTARPIQSTGEMVTEEARQRAGITGPEDDPDSSAPRDSAVPPT